MMKPNARPQMTEAQLMAKVAPLGITRLDTLFVVGIRGYYLDTMGRAAANDRGIYDDALFVVAPDQHFSAYNGNTDPSRRRIGGGTGAGKGMACLKPGLWRAHRLGLHKGQYRALIQTGGKVTVTRDGTPPYEDTGYFGINIHRGGIGTTSSEGCQTIPPEQWPTFIANVDALAKRLGVVTVPYALVLA
ncbi:hypothetical protein [Sphingomonas sp. LT1P40]|uniref:hypothetical protein n=1 Tax=Alteristakelama amylovorans TaxID=3096166 RepID=UPI002FCB09B6